MEKSMNIKKQFAAPLESPRTRKEKEVFNFEERVKRAELINAVKSNWDLSRIYRDRQVKLMLLDNDQSIVKVKVLSSDIENIDPLRELKEIPKNRYSSMVIAENAIDANILPKIDSLKMMLAFKDAGNVMGIPLYDYFIFSRNGYFSYAKNNFKV